MVKITNMGSISDSSSSSESEDETENELLSPENIQLNDRDESHLESGPFSAQQGDQVDLTQSKSPKSNSLESKLDVCAPLVVSVQSSIVSISEDSAAKSNLTTGVRDVVEVVPPKRARAGSDLDKYREKMANGSRKEVEERETPEKWRNRLWPSKAITSFCRILLRCKPPMSVPGERLVLSNKGVSQLTAHWKETDLSKIVVNFDSTGAHNAAFFLLVVEEARESVTKMDDFETISTPARTGTVDRREQTAFNRGEGRYNAGTNGWFDCEITAVVAESEFGKASVSAAAVDPRLGSVWIVSVAIIKPCSSGSTTNDSSTATGTGSGSSGVRDLNQFPLQKDSDMSGGDLMVMHSTGDYATKWRTPLLGVVQPWDPDYDLKFGVNFATSQASHIRNSGVLSSASNSGVNGVGVGPGSGSVLSTVNLMICVDHQYDGLSGDVDIGGWAATGSIVPGITFRMALVGNVLTAIRESQALMSLRTLNRPLQNAILCGRNNAFNAQDNNNNSSSSSGNGVSKVLSPSALRQKYQSDLDKVMCPENVPPALWRTLSAQYNESQLRAIKMVCNRSPGQESTISLLQGPPGTGKTKTILAVVSVFLAGALNPKKNGSTKIVAGTSFRAHADPRGKMSESGKYMYKHSVPSNAGYGLPPLHINTAAGSSTSSVYKPRVLLCAPSNTAVDELVFRLMTQGVIGTNGQRLNDISVVRIGHPCREEYKVKNQSRVFGAHKHAHSGHKSNNSNVLDNDGLTSQEHNMLRVVDSRTLDTLVDCHKTQDEYRMFSMADIRKSIMETADVVCCTLSGAGSQPILEVILRITGFKFDAVIIDEAAQAVEPSSLIPFKYNPQAVVMVGDPCQLPATVFSNAAKKCNFGQSLFQRLHISGAPMLMLETQYRMHPAIAQYPSQRFYSGRLVTDKRLVDSGSHIMPYHSDSSHRFAPVVFHDVSWGWEGSEGNSVSNREEAQYIVSLYDDLVRQYPQHKGGIGIIAPYRSQRRLLTNMFKDKYSGGANADYLLDLEISTVDGFQGREKNIVIFSCVRAPTKQQQSHYAHSLTQKHKYQAPPVGPTIGFLREWQRLNVAITRAKYALWIVGHAATLSADEEWGQLVAFMRANEYYFNPRAADSSGSKVTSSGHHYKGEHKHHTSSADRTDSSGHKSHHHKSSASHNGDHKHNSGRYDKNRDISNSNINNNGNSNKRPHDSSSHPAHHAHQDKKHRLGERQHTQQHSVVGKGGSSRSPPRGKPSSHGVTDPFLPPPVAVAAAVPKIDFKLNLQTPEQLRETQQFRAQETALQLKRDKALGISSSGSGRHGLGDHIHVSASCPVLFMPNTATVTTSTTSSIFRPPPPPSSLNIGMSSSRSTTSAAVPFRNPPVVGSTARGVPIQRPVSIDEGGGVGPFSAPAQSPRPVALLNQCIDLTSD